MSAWLGFFRSLVIYHSPATLRAWRRFYKDFLSPGDLAFDVGAHVGTRARAMRAAGAKVVALEPQAPFASSTGCLSLGPTSSTRQWAKQAGFCGLTGAMRRR
jgi:hypothetical protein